MRKLNKDLLQEEIRDTISQLRGLASPGAEVLSDYERINRFVRVASDAAFLLEVLEEEVYG